MLLHPKELSQNGRSFTEEDIGETRLFPQFRMDLRKFSEKEYNRFVTVNTVRDWSQLSWKQVGRPYEVRAQSNERRSWEQEQNREMDPHTAWTFFNKAFHEWFVKDVPSELDHSKKQFIKSLGSLKPAEIKHALGDVVRIQLWNYVHRIQDGIWDPRGKRALFEGLSLHKPKILFLGAAEGYEAMQLAAIYPRAHIVMVDYDEYCKTTRFAEFPGYYPFLGENPATGQPKVVYKDELNVDYIVDDIRNLDFGKDFDVVLSVGLLEHFPDAYKPEVCDWHRKFLKSGGYAILTTPRNQIRSRLYYKIMADVMNHTYRELMTVEQMGLYLYENGFDIKRHGYIKVHNGIVCQPR
ncbi:methyltransferase domain-containing protein [Halobacillus salinarum]|uniref:Methyltransferase domain-containing protein n=1 Tax=Halobacillus salinarum TaxID=2932257 RepID=A0ABY4EJ07_9BACI|nr:methyltransferase domain-containing protein [Halobacillus salinarum]UOQ44469.1 methyltransferase domain-containing protein [Halobacillus salinarum]